MPPFLKCVHLVLFGSWQKRWSYLNFGCIRSPLSVTAELVRRTPYQQKHKLMCTQPIHSVTVNMALHDLVQHNKTCLSSMPLVPYSGSCEEPPTLYRQRFCASISLAHHSLPWGAIIFQVASFYRPFKENHHRLFHEKKKSVLKCLHTEKKHNFESKGKSRFCCAKPLTWSGEAGLHIKQALVSSPKSALSHDQPS